MAINIRQLYSDLEPNISKDWNNDVTAVKGSAAVRNSLIGIVTTAKGTRPFDSNFGCSITDELFENMNPLTAESVKTSIISAIREYEPRISTISVDVIPDYDNNSLVVTIYFSIIDEPEEIEKIKLALSSS
ncbi:baseplate wedge subunit [Pectobacterium phage POP12]|nr:baseplate wedge subunit [Pectobacterium phage POP12]